MSESDTTSDTATDSFSTTSSVPKPGQLFKRKRREHEWAKEDVARALLLSVRQIEALENDEYDKLPGATYVVGYWHNYASLLKIDITESIGFHKKNLTAPPSSIVLKADHYRAHNRQESSRKQSALLFLVLSAMFLAGIWYWQNPHDNPIDQWLDAQSLYQLNDYSRSSEINADNGGNGTASASATSVNTTSQPVPSTNVSSVALPEPNFSDDVTASVVEEDDVATENVVKQAADKQNSRTQQVSDTQLTPTQVSEQADKLADEPPTADSPNWIFVTVEQRSWLDVRDVTGEKLIYRIANAGEAIALQGHPPFYVFIGVADVVRVEYLGNPVRFVAEKDSRFARFRVGRFIQNNQSE